VELQISEENNFEHRLVPHSLWYTSRLIFEMQTQNVFKVKFLSLSVEMVDIIMMLCYLLTLELNPPASGPKNDFFLRQSSFCVRKTWMDAGGALNRPTLLHEIDSVAKRRQVSCYDQNYDRMRAGSPERACGAVCCARWE
jgi:hypothetical protein